jgi:hypothetical protein
MNTPDLATLLPRFFTEHLVQQRNVSPRTVTAYRDTFRLLLRFLLRSRRTQSAELPLHVLTATSVLAFLSHLESERGNNVRRRNARLAAIRSLLHYASDLLGTELPEPTRRALSIPWKRYIAVRSMNCASTRNIGGSIRRQTAAGQDRRTRNDRWNQGQGGHLGQRFRCADLRQRPLRAGPCSNPKRKPRPLLTAKKG